MLRKSINFSFAGTQQMISDQFDWQKQRDEEGKKVEKKKKKDDKDSERKQRER